MEARFYAVLAHPLLRLGLSALVGLVALLFVGLFLPGLIGIAGWPPDFWALGYDARRLAGYLGALGTEGRRLYRLFLQADLGFAVLYGLWLAGWLYHLYRNPGPARSALAAALADLAEDLLLLVQLDAPREPLATIAGYLTFFKWVLLLYALFALLYGLWLTRRQPG